MFTKLNFLLGSLSHFPGVVDGWRVFKELQKHFAAMKEKHEDGDMMKGQ